MVVVVVVVVMEMEVMVEWSLTSVSLSNSMISMLSVSSGMVPSTKVTVEMTTTDIEVKAKI